MIFRSESGSGILSAATEEWRPFSQKKEEEWRPIHIAWSDSWHECRAVTGFFFPMKDAVTVEKGADGRTKWLPPAANRRSQAKQLVSFIQQWCEAR
jgi:hypothetical protein